MASIKVSKNEVEEFKKLVHYLAIWTELASPEIEFAVLLFTKKANDRPIEDVWLEFVKTHHQGVYKLRILYDRYPN
jgi:hypothetical protein